MDDQFWELFGFPAISANGHDFGTVYVNTYTRIQLEEKNCKKHRYPFYLQTSDKTLSKDRADKEIDRA